MLDIVLHLWKVVQNVMNIRENWISTDNMSLVMRKPAFCICENKDPDQLRGDPEADQRLCFRYSDSKILPLPKSEISSH